MPTQKLFDSVLYASLCRFVIGRLFLLTSTLRGIRRQFRLLASVSILVAVLCGGLLAIKPPTVAAASATNTVNFQARLESSTGAIVPDGNYNIEFKLYSVASGGSAEWTEDYTYDSGPSGADAQVQVLDGYLSVQLGSINAFPSTINWDQTQYLTMNIGGTVTSGTFPTIGDGEMDPRIVLTAVPYAFQAAQLSLLSGSNTSTLSFATQTSANTLLLPNESGTLCSTGSVCSGYAPSSGSNNYLQNGTSPQSGASFNVSGTGEVGTSLTTPSIQSSSGAGLSLTATGASNTGVLVNTGTNSTSAFQVQNTSDVAALNVDTTDMTTTLRAGTDAATLGSNLNTTTDFGNAAWSSTGWTTTSTTATNNSSNTSPLSTSQFTLTPGDTYQVSYQISGGPSAGSILAVTLGGTDVKTYTFSGNSAQDDGTDTVNAVFTAGSPELSFLPSADFTGTISNVSVELLTPNSNPSLVLKNTSGDDSLEFRASGSTSNAFIGNSAGQSNTTGTNNTSLGTSSLESNTSGGGNTALGSGSLQSNTTGNSNTAIGNGALQSNTTGIENTALGDDADVASDNLINVTAIGYGAVVSASNTIVLGNTSVSCVIIGASSCSSHSGEELGVEGIGVASGGFMTGTPDVAEYIDASPGVEAADVVVADPNNAEAVTTTTKAYDTAAVGVITNGTSGFQMLNAHYGQSFNSLTDNTDAGALPMAVTGRVPVKVTGQGGPIAPGDYITTSTTPGYGMKADQAGAVIGKALGYFSGTSSSDTGTVLVLIDLSYYAGADPDTGVQNGGAASLADLTVTDSATINNLNASGATTITDLSVQNEMVSGNLTVSGVATVGSLVVSGDANFAGSIIVGGHIVTYGNAPTIAVQPADGQPAISDLLDSPSSATVTGDDDTGTIAITTSDNPTSGDIANVTFSQAYTGTPHVIISAQDGNSAGSSTYPSGESTTGFQLNMGNKPQPNTTYTFDYIIAQ